VQTYLFYDLETTGLSKAFDQILHFAAIRTDMNLKELNRYEIKVKLNRDLVPSPYALLVHQLSIRDTSEGICEYDAVKQIHQWMNEPGTISLGYNTLNFDDEFLRFSFYRNLLPPYTHQYANQCSRMDLYPMTVMYFLFKRQAIKWPYIDEKLSLKLENLNAANQFVSGRAHDAMIDVEVTLALAKRFQQESDMWQYLQGYFNKPTEQTRLKNLTDKQAILIDGSFGLAKNYQSPVYFLGYHQHYKNQTAWLSLDTPTLSNSTTETFQQNLWVTNKKLAEPGFILPMSGRFLAHLNAERLAQAEENNAWLLKHPELFEKIIAHYTHFTYPPVPEADVDARLYLDGFWSTEEIGFCQRFHQASAKEKAVLIDTCSNPQLAALATRIVGRHFPDVLTTKQTQNFAQYLQQVNPPEGQASLCDYKGFPRLTPRVAKQDILKLRQGSSLTAENSVLLAHLEQYLTAIFG
jgi:exodeoxyribonuclease-1